MHLQFSREDLVAAYEVEKLSLADIAKRYGCTRQAILAHFKKMGIPTRSHSQARSLAISRGKVRYPRESDDGTVSPVQLQAHVFNRVFFKTWTSEMAYVLGVIYTDGNLSDRSGDFRVSISQKEPELLLKIRALLGSNARLQHSKKKGIRGELYTLQFSDQEIYHDLRRIGLTPRKSHGMLFPKVPPHLVRHFIRGCWDGDGTVFVDARGNRVAAFGCGSKPFVESMLGCLFAVGLPLVELHEDPRSPGYWYFRIRGRHFVTLFHVLYDDTDDSMRLTRKYDVFRG